MDSEGAPESQQESSIFGIGKLSIKSAEGHSEVTHQTNGVAHPLPGLEESTAPYKVILQTGDVIVEYFDPESDISTKSEARHRRWRVSSADLAQNSPYFRALLDPDKFSEGRRLMQQKMMHQKLLADKMVNAASSDNQNVEVSYLPVVILPSKHVSSRLGLDAIKLFLEILSFNSFGEEQKCSFDAELKFLPVSLIARLLELSDAFNSPNVVRESLKRAGYAFGKGKYQPSKFDSSLLKLSEDRIRQTVFVARILDEPVIYQVMTHALIVLGSKSWTNGVEPPVTPTYPWRYFPNGIEGIIIKPVTLDSLPNPFQAMLIISQRSSTSADNVF